MNTNCPMCGVSLKGEYEACRTTYRGRALLEGIHQWVTVCSSACGRASILAERMFNIARTISDVELQLIRLRSD